MVSESAENLEVIRGGVPPEATETPPSSAVNVWPIPACLTPNRGDHAMTHYWGYPFADVLAIVVIVGLSALALYQARTYTKQL